MTTCRRVTIFEGPDGSGKTTAALAFAKETGARYVHCGPFPRVTSKGLGRMYIEAMMPALLGLHDVVMDRCWMSEPIYGRVFRDGKDRLGSAGRRILSRIALRCDARVVLCLPDYDTCLINWRHRHVEGGEYLEREAQLKAVWEQYIGAGEQRWLINLPIFGYDYTRGELRIDAIRSSLNDAHDVNAQTAGSRVAKVLLVGDDVSDHTDYDSLLQFPFCGLNPRGCSRWLTDQLSKAGIHERELFWTNARAPGVQQVVEEFLENTEGVGPVALGTAVEQQLAARGIIASHVVPHPRRWRMYKSNVDRFGQYPLIPLLKDVLS